MAKNKRAKLTKADMRLLKSFGERVRQLREQKKLSVYDVTGKDLAIKSRQHWQKIENGQKNINLTTVRKIAETLKVDIKELLSEMQ